MSKNKFLQWIILFILTLSITKMNAQENKTNQNLNAKEQSLVKISSLTATGNLGSLKLQLNAGLDSGLTINEIKEALVQLYAYCGFPRSLNAINTFKSVVDERKSKGINDIEGKKIIVENNVEDKYEQGRKTLEELTKMPQTKPAPGFGEFAPRVDAFLKEHLFADIFVSDVLTYKQREIVTISALASLDGVEGQLQSHINMGKNTGITENQLAQLADLIQETVNKTQANTARKIIAKPLVPIIEKDMMIRISEIEIIPEFLEEYNSILKEEASASVKLEKGVIAIFPMYQKENSTQLRIVEIYADKEAYQLHLQTPHFLKYKSSTLKMVKSLKLIDMESIDKEAMSYIFKKIK
ncbi:MULTISPECIES: carboxymuconolactone decarboxylase family protein [unclassified Chryseobacterium]|uniref:carboxymuconolactone decarboxylase family protein n=1 Tax=unclassified Chryseobacterium TaxID=2593645 RepID=UPI001B6C5EFE|nr:MULTISPECIES: carboxymuconolactone decarboxylase family protein [unclassified Chryseobacterium]MBP1163267.1 alkylhydroperoxidase/carboxymuconolactone decarboxylase family protein YurZ/quinol monooxygenase YgiN [Chryseobacterium sp. PvR013]MDR4894605.1 carboxymuconolactone decarboxylase family protein [Chryseobacterium sp. CFS7]